MEVSALSIMFAKAYGIYFTVVGLALLVDPSRFRAWYEDILAEGRRVVFGGTVALLIGSFILASHHDCIRLASNYYINWVLGRISRGWLLNFGYLYQKLRMDD